MTTVNLTDADIRLRDAVQRQLEWDPEVDAGAIGVAARSGAVTLTGHIESYAGKLAAERAAKQVRGVRAVANEIEVRLRLERTDVDIARDAVQALTLHGAVPEGVQAVVHRGHVTLTGEVTALFQKQEAEVAVRHIRGAREVLNQIVVVPPETVGDIRRRIVRALHQSADVDARHITVAISGETATLSGTVGTWLQRESAERAAQRVPGIAHVDNRIVVEPPIESRPEDADEAC